MKLHLGVVDTPYVDAEHHDRVTTGEVAEKLENEYGVMHVFYEDREKRIAALLEKAVQSEINNLIKYGKDPSLSGINLSKVEAMFRDYLDMNDWTRITGRIIKSAVQGKSLRFKAVEGRRASRPAFIDTGLYQSSFKAWITK